MDQYHRHLAFARDHGHQQPRPPLTPTSTDSERDADDEMNCLFAAQQLTDSDEYGSFLHPPI
jgi:hypothetical protein